ncbi:MAG: hydrogenase nickel incorporation protein HypB [candidate division KSB1 bacterium]|nr:hydrogenase nickel incorporation protein HypB [candidate division KSB1 bacterium]MDZ7304304.1 hydrogenase nickel incorporation protein HypB [candidate division KSB1 bacterium]MDZ7313581.1 hydrogenase nickel incorporation protein HypB [candidate division KSB1 bacterium]
MSEKISVEKKVLSENDKLAADIRAQLKQRGIVALNFVSSPGSGKTSLLEKTLGALNNELRIGLIAGDVQTENDANRLKAAGGKMVRPIVTGGACHLDAKMVSRVLPELDLDKIDLLFIENVGNLVCPSSYDLGEDMKVVLISTTEGDDKPLKYPAMFRRAAVMVINKIDLLGSSDFDMNRVKENARSINADLKIFEVSCRTGQGLEAWYNWLNELVATQKKVQ